MRLSELVGLEVVDCTGTRMGTVVDLQLVQDGPLLGPYGAAFRVAGLVTVERRQIRLLGFDRDVGPWLLRRIVHSISGPVHHVPWEHVGSVADGQVRLQPGREL
jgi:hypothetical protein